MTILALTREGDEELMEKKREGERERERWVKGGEGKERGGFFSMGWMGASFFPPWLVDGWRLKKRRERGRDWVRE